MARTLLEVALAPEALDTLFEQHSDRQYTRSLLFSTMVDLMGVVVSKSQPCSFSLAADFRISESFPVGWPKWKILCEHSIVWTGSRHLTPGRPWTGRAAWAMAESTLEEVMQAYVDGDATAFDQIYRRVAFALLVFAQIDLRNKFETLHAMRT